MEDSKQVAGPLNRDEILSIAKAEGYYLAEYDTPDGVVVHVWADGCITDLLETVAAAGAAAEREACAKLCDHYAVAMDHGGNEYTRSRECQQAAAAIRARQEAQQ